MVLGGDVWGLLVGGSVLNPDLGLVAMTPKFKFFQMWQLRFTQLVSEAGLESEVTAALGDIRVSQRAVPAPGTWWHWWQTPCCSLNTSCVQQESHGQLGQDKNEELWENQEKIRLISLVSPKLFLLHPFQHWWPLWLQIPSLIFGFSTPTMQPSLIYWCHNILLRLNPPKLWVKIRWREQPNPCWEASFPSLFTKDEISPPGWEFLLYGVPPGSVPGLAWDPPWNQRQPGPHPAQNHLQQVIEHLPPHRSSGESSIAASSS